MCPDGAGGKELTAVWAICARKRMREKNLQLFQNLKFLAYIGEVTAGSVPE